MLPLLDSGCFQPKPTHYVINIDESWLNGTRFVRRVWAPSNAPATITDKQVSPRISLILAIDSEGHIWYSLTQVNTDSDVMTMFLRKLMSQLDLERPGWVDSSTVLLDNASWHVNRVMKQRLARIELPVIFSGPYSYSTAPAELVFAALKLGDLNPERLPTGKRGLTNLANMVGNKLASIARSTRIRYWHHCSINLYSYLYYERL